MWLSDGPNGVAGDPLGPVDRYVVPKCVSGGIESGSDDPAGSPKSRNMTARPAGSCTAGRQ